MVTRILTYGAWLIGALVVPIGYWATVIYLVDHWNRGYGRDTWFQLQIFLAVIGVGVGLVAYVAAGFFRNRPTAASTAVIAGLAFGVCELVFVLALRRAFPDRDMVPQELMAAFLIGAASVLVGLGRAA